MKSLGAVILFVIVILISPSSYTRVPPILSIIRCDTVQTLFGFGIVPLGDENGDGLADFLVEDGRSIGFIYYGGSPISTVPARRIHGIRGFLSNVGDVNGDGYAELACWQTKLGLFFGGNGLDTVPRQIFGLDTLIPIGYTVASRDIGCSGKTRLLSTRYDFSSVLQFDIKTPSDSAPTGILRPWWFHHPGVTFGEALTTGDFNGDGKEDVVTNLRPDEQYGLKSQVCMYWGGCGFDSIPDLLFSQSGPFDYTKIQFSMVICNAGDLNADSLDDLFVGHWESQDPTGLIYFGGPAFDSIPDLIITDSPSRAKPGGDLNGDGYEDLITSYPLESSSFSYVDIFYGGPSVDSIQDLRINVWEMPEYLLEFGMGIAGLGDVNGDGINDFAASAVDARGHGVVYIFSGQKSGTDVNDGTARTLPTSFTLHTPYPNPFNPSTTISFDLPKRGSVKLVVYDLLGREVRKLIDKEMSAGTHSITWDGTTATGKPAASGTYFFKLTADGVTKSVKGMLVK
jgi:hypothetical protein